MAARLWRSVLLLQAALAVAIAWVITRRAPSAAHLWLGIDVVVLAFCALQYLFVFLIIAASRLLAPATAARPDRGSALRAALTEPVYFALAELAMARGGRVSAGTSPAGPRPLLLVHGLACNAGIWHWLTPRLRAAGFGPIRAVQLEPLTGDIDGLVRDVARELASLHAQAGSPVTVLAHSLGGLLCRAALRGLDPRVVSRLVTLGTPHHGAALARLSSMPPIAQMRPDSAWLAQLNARQAPVSAASIYGVDDNFVVPAASAELAGARSHALRGLGHFGLLVSRRAGDQVLRALQEAA
jgi:pimeloyl-ACP methyl ester carboxylesterase